MNKISRTLTHPFHATNLFRYPLKTLENKGFLMFSGGIERDQWHEMGESLSHVMMVS